MTQPIWKGGQSRKEFQAELRDYRAPKKATKKKDEQAEDLPELDAPSSD